MWNKCDTQLIYCVFYCLSDFTFLNNYRILVYILTQCDECIYHRCAGIPSVLLYYNGASMYHQCLCIPSVLSYTISDFINSSSICVCRYHHCLCYHRCSCNNNNNNISPSKAKIGTINNIKKKKEESRTKKHLRWLTTAIRARKLRLQWGQGKDWPSVGGPASGPCTFCACQLSVLKQ